MPMLGDTIAAIATPRGVGALSIVRISGPAALDVADVCFRGRRRPTEIPTHTVAYGRIVDGNGETLDRVLLTVMRGPRTSTGEDTAEISGHGGPWLSARILDRVLEAGARPAEPGEFTRRAVLNGRMDLVQAEGVLEIIRARTETGLKAALRQAEGGASRTFDALREKLDECRVQMECAIEFEEDAAPWSDTQIQNALEGIRRDLDEMLANSEVGRRLQEGADVAILGRPNVGKSTLFNELAGKDRVIVSPTPGTTRDVVTEWISVEGIPVRLMDTAGLRPAGCSIERAAVDRAKDQGERAEIVLYLLDASQPPDGEDLRSLEECGGGRALVVLNKMDLGSCPEADLLLGDLPEETPVVRMSALTGDGLEDLKQKLSMAMTAGRRPEDGLTASVRQIDTLRRTKYYINKSISAIENCGAIELAATDLRDAVEVYGTLVGVTPPETILDQVFSRFCMGK